MKSNLIKFQVDEIQKIAQMFREKRPINWEGLFPLDEKIKPTYIQVMDENRKEVAYATWGWNGDKLKFGKVKVKPKKLRKQKVATVLMKMVITIAKKYQTTKITGTIDGEPFLWKWYCSLGFTIHDQNKLLMVFEY